MASQRTLELLTLTHFSSRRRPSQRQVVITSSSLLLSTHHGKPLYYVSSALIYMLHSPFAHTFCEETVNLVIIVGMSIHERDLEVRLSYCAYSHWLLGRIDLAWSNQRNPPGDKVQFPFSIDSMTRDLTAHVDKPLWPLSSYGPAKSEPNLLSGLDESPEELRVRAVTALRAGNTNEYVR